MAQDKNATETNTTSEGFTDEEQAAMKARAKEMKAEAREQEKSGWGKRCARGNR